jgi:hypothetical protein
MRMSPCWSSSGLLCVSLLAGCLVEHTNPVDPDFQPARGACVGTPERVGETEATAAQFRSALATGHDGALAAWVDVHTGDVLVRRVWPSGLGAVTETVVSGSPSRLALATLDTGWVACWSALPIVGTGGRRPLRCRSVDAAGVPYGPIVDVADNHGYGPFAIASHAGILSVAFLTSGDRGPVTLTRTDAALGQISTVEFATPTGFVRDISIAAGADTSLILVHDSSSDPLALTLSGDGELLESLRLPGGDNTATAVATATTSDGVPIAAYAAYTSNYASPGICSFLDGALFCDGAAPQSPLLRGGEVAIATAGEEVVLAALGSNESRGVVTWLRAIAGRLYDVRIAEIPLGSWFHLAAAGGDPLLMEGRTTVGPSSVELTITRLSCE